MLDQIMTLVREQAGSLIDRDPELPNEKKEEVARAAGDSVISGLQGMLQGGQIKDLLRLFGTGDVSQNAASEEVGHRMADNLKQAGLPASKASGLAGTLAPMVLSALVGRAKDPSNNQFNVQDIFNQLSGGKTSGMDIGSLVNRFAGGLDQDGDGDVDLQDIMALLGTGSSGGGLMDRVKGIFGSK